MKNKIEPTKNGLIIKGVASGKCGFTTLRAFNNKNPDLSLYFIGKSGFVFLLKSLLIKHIKYQCN